jgi:hypothetical protein
VRPEIVEAVKFKTEHIIEAGVHDDDSTSVEVPGKMTLAEAAAWANKLRTFQPMEPDEERLVTEQWVVLVSAIAQREGVMPGILAYIVDELAFTLRIPLPRTP